MISLNSLVSRYRESENPLRTERRLELAAVVLFLVWLLWASVGGLLHMFTGAPEPIEPAQGALKVGTLTLDAPLDEPGSAAILARPLFWNSRRPLEAKPEIVEEPVVKAKPAPKKLEGVELHGVFGTGDNLGLIATIDGRMGRIRPGDLVKGWRLLGYEGGVANFESGGTTRTLRLELTTPSVVVKQKAPSGDEQSTSGDEEPRLSFGGH